MKTINPYQPDNALQKAYNRLWGGCLCGHFERCCFCVGSMDEPRRAIEETAEVIGYQLYLRPMFGRDPSPIRSLREREPWKYLKAEHPSTHDTMQDEQTILKNMLEES